MRRKGDSFYVGGLTGVAERRTAFALDFLQPGREYRIDLLTDDPSDASTPRGYRLSRQTVRKDDAVMVTMAPSGGFCAVISPRR